MNNIKKQLQIEYKETTKIYQAFPAYYLKELKPEQKGLLIFHKMGTGKTFTGLHLLNEFSDKKAVVVCPDYLIETWKKEQEKLGVMLSIQYIDKIF